jgi:hypothetical protein
MLLDDFSWGQIHLPLMGRTPVGPHAPFHSPLYCSRRVQRPGLCPPPPWYYRTGGRRTDCRVGLSTESHGSTTHSQTQQTNSWPTSIRSSSLRWNSADGQLQLILTARRAGERCCCGERRNVQSVVRVSSESTGSLGGQSTSTASSWTKPRPWGGRVRLHGRLSRQLTAVPTAP